MAWLSQFFINSSFVLPGLAMVSIPVLIHLINRLRYRRIRWAAMEFLLASMKRNRRKLLIEQLILLLLRMLAVAGLVLLIARPFFDPSQLLILQGQKTHHVVLLDDTGSMRDSMGEQTVFEGALDVVRKIAGEGARQAGTQQMTLATLSHPEQPVFIQQDLSPEFLSELETRLENLSCSYRHGDVITAIQRLDIHFKQPAAAKHLHVISDFRSDDWQHQEAGLEEVARGLEEQTVSVNFIRAVPEMHENIAVTELGGDVHNAAANVPLRLTVRVKNFGSQEVEKTRLAVFLDNEKLPLSPGIEKLLPNQEVGLEFDIKVPTSGPHNIRVELPADSLPGDNTRYLAIDFRDSRPILILTSDLRGEEVQFLRDALSPRPGLTGFDPQVDSVEFLRRNSLSPYSCVYLLNVPEIPPDALRSLEDYVRKGGGLAWFVGPSVRTAFYSDKLFNQGAGLFPVPLGIPQDLVVDPTQPGPDIEFEPVPAFALFRDPEYVKSLIVERYFGVPPNTSVPDTVRVVARLRNGAPFLLQHSYGEGRIFTYLTTCGKEWHSWPTEWAYVVLQLIVQSEIARREEDGLKRDVGQPIELKLDPSIYRSQFEIRPPNDSPLVRSEATIKPTPEGTTPPKVPLLEEAFVETDEPGVYQVVRYLQNDSTELEQLAFNVPLSESSLQLSKNDQIRSQWGESGKLKIQDYGNFDWVQSSRAGQEVRDIILIVLLLVLVCEQLMAVRLSYHPK